MKSFTAITKWHLIVEAMLNSSLMFLFSHHCSI